MGSRDESAISPMCAPTNPDCTWQQNHLKTDGSNDDCSICRGELPFDFVQKIITAAAKLGITMTADEFKAWLRTRGSTPNLAK